jgi:hypothetical protein
VCSLGALLGTLQAHGGELGRKRAWGCDADVVQAVNSSNSDVRSTCEDVTIAAVVPGANGSVWGMRACKSEWYAQREDV